MLRRAAGQRLHLVLGRPWKDALIAFKSAGLPDRGLWESPAYDQDDLLLTVLDTRPRTLLCLERAARGSGSGRTIYVSEVVAFPHLVFVDAVVERLGARLPAVPGPVADGVADALLAAVEQELVSPTPRVVREGRRCASSSRERSSGLQASVLASADGRCAACDRDYGLLFGGLGAAALEVHHLEALAEQPDDEVATTIEQLVAVCGSCHKLLHAKPLPSLQQLRYAWGPACPECDAHASRSYLWGMPAGPVPDDVVLGGCALPDWLPQWQCGSCGYEWRVDEEPSPGELGYDVRMMLRDHWPLPRDGGSTYNFDSDDYLVEMTRVTDGRYKADYWQHAPGPGQEHCDRQIIKVDTVVPPSNLKTMCAAMQVFMEAVLEREGKDSDVWR